MRRFSQRSHLVTLSEINITPLLDLVFVLDCSGSMSGQPIAQAKAAVKRALHRLQPGDSFQLINFSEKSSQLGPRPLEATPENIQRGLNYLHALNGDGPTMMIEGIKSALDFPHDQLESSSPRYRSRGFAWWTSPRVRRSLVSRERVFFSRRHGRQTASGFAG
jgi:hypothetical protein